MKSARWIVGVVLLAAVDAQAKPSIWDEVRDPNTVKIEKALVAALRAREPGGLPEDLPPDLHMMRAELALHAAAVLELAGGEVLPSPELRHFLGDSLVLADRGRDEDGRRILRRALAAAPDSPEAAQAWFQVAIASNRLLDFEAERDAYGEALRTEWDADQRAGIYMNRGEASMSLGELRGAREDFLTALSLAEDSTTHALADWDLAVALARDDDLPDALGHAWDASQIEFRDSQGTAITAIELPTVFFTPDYEIFYYRALAAMAAAERAEKPEVRKTELEWALSQWQRYLAEARAKGGRWVKNAEYQKRWCERRLEVRK